MSVKRAAVLFLIVAGAALSVFYWWTMSRPVIVVDAFSDRLSCVSYSPFRDSGKNVGNKNVITDASELEEDIKLLAQRFDCIRIYSVAKGLHEVPRLAQKYNIKVLLGLWIGRNAAENERELAKGIDVAKKNPDAIRAIIVGNEVLLRGEQPVTQLAAYLERVKSAVPNIPVTYADVWEFWTRNASLADKVDFLTIHILPYWEDHPINIDNAVGHVSHIYQHVKSLIPGKTVMIGETGWPSYGRRRQGADPTLVNQARFVREFAVRAELEKIPYNVIEAFDQSWKRGLEGAAGGYWGLYNRAAQAKFPFRGPVAEAPTWSLAAMGAMAAFLVLFLRRWRVLQAPEMLLLAAVSVIGGGVCASFVRFLSMTSRTLTEAAAMGVYAAALPWAIVVLGATLAAWLLRGEPIPAVASFSYLVRWIRRNDQSFDKTARSLGALRILFLFGAAYVSLLLAFDPRYRDFPLALYAVPAVGYALISWITGRSDGDMEEWLLAGIIGVTAVWSALREHLILTQHEPWRWADDINPYALIWAGLGLALAGSVLIPVFFQLRPRHGETAQ